jgi:ketosteroid isomerase-like protein
LRRTLIVLVCLAAAAAAAGCGKSDSQKAQDVVDAYASAQNNGNFKRVCELYSDEFRAQLKVSDLDQCARFVEEQSSGNDTKGETSVADLRIKGDRATADLDIVHEGEGPVRVSLTLEKQGGGWKITGLQ